MFSPGCGNAPDCLRNSFDPAGDRPAMYLQFFNEYQVARHLRQLERKAGVERTRQVAQRWFSVGGTTNSGDTMGEETSDMLSSFRG